MSTNVSLNGCERIIINAGAQRVSDNAIIELRNILEKLGADISKEAWDLARHAGRVTVKDIDIERASKKFTYNYW